MNIEFCKECADFKKCTYKEENCPYFEEEQAELQQKADKMPRKYEKSDKKAEQKSKTVKISQEKQELFSEIYDYLCETMVETGRKVEILKENKLISVKIGEKVFKIDIIEQRKPK